MATSAVKLRIEELQGLVVSLKDAKQQQDDRTSRKGPSNGVWLSFQLWRSVLQSLGSQVKEILAWEQLLLNNQKEIVVGQERVKDLDSFLNDYKSSAQSKIAALDRQVSRLQADLDTKQDAWSRQKQQMDQQVDGLVADVQSRATVLQENADLARRVRDTQRKLEEAESAAKEATSRANELQKRLNHVEAVAHDGLQGRDALVQQVRDLGIQMSAARDHIESQRVALAARRHPTEQMAEECKRLRADNRRLVALLSKSKAWSKLAGQLEPEGLEGVQYMPVHEVLLAKGEVAGLYPPLLDRPVNGSTQEDWSWLPIEAVECIRDVAARVLPGQPLEPLLGMLLAVNKIWHKREAAALQKQREAYEEELRELHRLYRQRAPYEAVVGKTRLTDLKRQLRVQATAAQHLVNTAATRQKDMEEHNKVLLALSLESVNAMSKQVKKAQATAGKLKKNLVVKKKERPPVCVSCLDNILLRTSPSVVQDPYQERVIGNAQLLTKVAATPTGNSDTMPILRPAQPGGHGNGYSDPVAAESMYGQVSAFKPAVVDSMPSTARQGAVAGQQSFMFNTPSGSQQKPDEHGSGGEAHVLAYQQHDVQQYPLSVNPSGTRSEQMPSADAHTRAHDSLNGGQQSTAASRNIPWTSQPQGADNGHLFRSGITRPAMVTRPGASSASAVQGRASTAGHGLVSGNAQHLEYRPWTSSTGSTIRAATASSLSTAAAAGARNVDPGLTQKYSEPVMKFSVWGENGSLRHQGAVDHHVR